MTKATFVAVLVLSFNLFALNYPSGPNLEVTPGDLCKTPGQIRYPEKIKYCVRDVDSELKRQIIAQYDRDFGFDLLSIKREDIKIDHFIPLCMGGSNARENLWPQYKAVYAITDPLEPLLCDKMAAGRLKQADAVKMIRAAKLDLSKVKEILKSAAAL